MNIKLVLFGLSNLLAFSVSTTAFGFNWKSEGASAQGTGCNSLPNGQHVDVSFLSNGPDLSVVFTSLGIELNDPSQGLRAQKNCNMRIPFLLEPGSFEGQLSETVTIGLTKTEGADAQVDFRSRVLDTLPGSWGSRNQFNPMQNRFGRGVNVNEPLVVKSRETVLGQDGRSRRCQFTRNAQNAHVPFNYDAQLTLTASRQDINQHVLLQADAVDVRLDLSQKLQPCENGRPRPGGPVFPIPGGPGGRPTPPPVVIPIPQPRPTPPVVTPVPRLSVCHSQNVQLMGARGGLNGMGWPGERLFGFYQVPQLQNAVDFQIVHSEYHSFQNVDPYNLQVHVGNQNVQLQLLAPSQWIPLVPGTNQFGISTMINQRPNNNAAGQNFTINIRFAYRKHGPC